MADAHANFAISTVLTPPGPPASGTSLTVAAGGGARFPAPPFNAVIWPALLQPTALNAEIVRVTAVATDTFTIVRQQEGTGTRLVVAGDQIAAAITAKVLTDVEASVAAETGRALTAEGLLIPLTQKGAAGGVATLDGSTLVPLAQLPPSVANVSQAFQTVGAATGVGATDRAAIQAAHDALPANGGTILLQAGAYALDATGLVFTKPNVRIQGAGGSLAGAVRSAPTARAATTITYTSTTGTAITCSGTGGYTFERFALIHTSVTGDPAPTAGAGLVISGGSALTAGAGNTQIVGCSIVGFFDNIQMLYSYLWTIDRCAILDPVRYGVYVNNGTTWMDYGAFSICNCYTQMFFTTRNPSAWVRWESGGGVRIVNNQFNASPWPGNTTAGIPDVVLDFAIQDGATTGDIQIVGNDINAMKIAGIRLGTINQSAPTGGIHAVLIEGNSFNVNLGGGLGYGVQLGAPTSGTSLKVQRITITGNQFWQLNTSIKATYAQYVTIGPNDHHAVAGPIIAVGSGSTLDTGVIGLNMARQAIFDDGNEGQSRDIYLDWRSLNTLGQQSGVIEHRYRRQAITSVAGAWITQYIVGTFPTNSGGNSSNMGSGKITVRVVGFDWDGGAVFLEQVRAFTQVNATTSPTLTTIGTDVSTGGGAANTALQYVLTANTITIQLQTVAGAIHAFQGSVELIADGVVRRIYQGP